MGEPNPSRDLVRDVYAELARLRGSGRVPGDLDERLEAAFARVAPSAALQGDTSAAIDHAEALAVLDPHGDVAGRSPFGTAAKRVVRKATYWYALSFTAQIADFGAAVARAGRLLERRVEALERGEPMGSRTALARASIRPEPCGDEVLAVISGLIGDVAGVSFVGEVGTGEVLDAVDAASDDVIAVDPRLEVTLADHAAPVRLATVSDALSTVEERSLGCVVLAGVVDTATSEARVRLAQEAALRLRSGGRMIILSADPDSTNASRVVERDLAGAMPFHRQTWRHVLMPLLDDLAVTTFGDRYLVTGTRP